MTLYSVPWLPKKLTSLMIIYFIGMLLSAATYPAEEFESSRMGIVEFPGEEIYKERCGLCHDNPQNHTPPKSSLGSQAPEQIFNTLTKGVMRAQGVLLSSQQKTDVAEYLTGKKIGATRKSLWIENACKKPIQLKGVTDEEWNGWGKNKSNTRYQPNPGISKKDIESLKVKWSFAYPADGRRNSQPSIVGNYIYTAQFPGNIFALDAGTGCTIWNLDVKSGVRNSVTVVKATLKIKKEYPGVNYIALFGTNDNHVFGVDAETGHVLWKTKIEENPIGRVTGSGIFHEGVFYVPMSSNEEVAATGVDYSCCTFRGSVSAIDISNGKSIWKTYVIDEAPSPTKINSNGKQMYGPAGAAIWSSPTIDEQRGLLYVATGDSYTDVIEDGSDAIVAIELKTGKIRWKNQVTSNDNFVIGCGRGRTHGNCPEELGPDYDFGSSPVLFEFPNKKTVLLAGQKSSDFYMLNPDNGKIIWQEKLGRGGALGGILWGFAVDDEQAYVAVSDMGGKKKEGAKPGLTAINIQQKKIVWHTPAPENTCKADMGFRCTAAFPQAVTVIPGVVFVGGADGYFRAFDSNDGKILWNYNAAGTEYKTVNGTTVKGGYFDGGGAVIANGMMVVNSGFNVRQGQEGNVMLVFTQNGK